MTGCFTHTIGLSLSNMENTTLLMEVFLPSFRVTEHLVRVSS